MDEKPYFCEMKNACLYLLIIITAAYSTGLSELAKTPAFISHYKEHRADNSASGLQEFISMHYFGHDKKDDDHQKDEALPFKNHHNKPSVYTKAEIAYPIIFSFKYTIAKKVIPYREGCLALDVALAFFRPPCVTVC